MPTSDDFSPATKRQIAARAGHLCAYPDCFAPTSGPSDEGDSVNIGEAAHITGASPEGPRYDASITSEQRRDEENGIWMCRTHAALIDRDLTRFTKEVLRDWKYQSEDRARRLLGKPIGCAVGRLASVSPAVRLGADTSVLVEGQPIPHTYIFSPDKPDARLTWFVNAFVIRFAIQKKHNLRIAVLSDMVVVVHEMKQIPQYRKLMQVFPAATSLYYVSVDSTIGTARREFRPTRFFLQATGDAREREEFPPAVVLDDDVPAQIALRFNAKTPGMYLLSLEASVSADEERETLTVMTPQWVIFEQPLDDYDPRFGA